MLIIIIIRIITIQIRKPRNTEPPYLRKNTNEMEIDGNVCILGCMVLAIVYDESRRTKERILVEDVGRIPCTVEVKEDINDLTPYMILLSRWSGNIIVDLEEVTKTRDKTRVVRDNHHDGGGRKLSPYPPLN